MLILKGFYILSISRWNSQNKFKNIFRSSSAPIGPSKTLSLIPKKFLSAENRMQQLQSAGKVLKRGVRKPVTSQE